MIELSTNAKFRLQTNQKVLFKADFTLDKHFGRNQYITNTNLTLHGDDVMSGSATISDSTSSSGSFDIGSAIINSFNVTLNNFDGRFALYDFTDATMKVYLGIPLVDNVTDESSSSQVEWIVKGFYTVDKPTSIGNTIPLTMLDNMSKFERPFKNIGNLGANESIGTYIDYMCNYCGVVLGQNVPHPEWKVKSRPTDENITCLDMIGYIAQINGCYARINRNGYLDFKWYKFEPDIVVTDYDGGSFHTSTTPYSDGVSLDGGSFDHTSVEYKDTDGVTRQRYAFTEDIDGGNFNYYGGFDSIESFKSYSVGTDRITITGIEFTVENLNKESTTNDNVYLYDKQGNITDSETDRKNSAREYCLSISGNKLMPLLNNLTTCMSYIANKVCGNNFLPFNITALSNPKWEAGDSCSIWSNSGDRYDTIITSISYPLNGYMSFSCNAESPSENNSSHSSPLTTALASIKNDTQKQITAYDEAVHRLNQLSSNALGFYTTTVKNELDGSKIEYMHDKEELSQSLHAFKMQGDAFLIGERATTDVDFEWKGGVDMSSNAVFRYLVAEGIDASTINVTNLVVGENVTMGSNATINWDKVSDKPNNLFVDIETLYYSARVWADDYNRNKPNPPSKPTSQVTTDEKEWGIWSKSMHDVDTSINEWNGKSTYECYYWMCNQYKQSDGSYSWSEVIEYDNTVATTLITKNAITTSFINALKITADKVSANGITAGTIDADVVTISNLEVGKNVTMGEDVTIDWTKVNNHPTDVSSFNNDVGYALTSDIPNVSNAYVGIETLYYSARVWADDNNKNKPNTPNKPTSQVTTSSKIWDIWSKVPCDVDKTLNANGKSTYECYYWICSQYKKKDGSYEWSTVSEYDNTVATTLITKNAITTSFINALNITADKVSANGITAGNIDGVSFRVGYNNSSNSYIKQYNYHYNYNTSAWENTEVGKWDSSGIELKSSYSSTPSYYSSGYNNSESVLSFQHADDIGSYIQLKTNSFSWVTRKGYSNENTYTGNSNLTLRNYGAVASLFFNEVDTDKNGYVDSVTSMKRAGYLCIGSELSVDGDDSDGAIYSYSNTCKNLTLRSKRQLILNTENQTTGNVIIDSANIRLQNTSNNSPNITVVNSRGQLKTGATETITIGGVTLNFVGGIYVG